MPAIVNLERQATLGQVSGLTQKEQIVLITVLGLFLMGWTLKVWRQVQEPPAAEEVSE